MYRNLKVIPPLQVCRERDIRRSAIKTSGEGFVLIYTSDLRSLVLLQGYRKLSIGGTMKLASTFDKALD